MTTVKARDLGYEVDGRVIFGEVDLTIEAGDSIAIFGPSGSGKTSLVSILACLQPATRGQLLIDGEAATAAHRSGLVVVPQTYGLLSLLTASENVEAALRAGGWKPADAVAAAAGPLEALGLAGQRHQLVEELSGGQQQRVAVARALARRPALLLADEPTAEQDAENRQLVIGRLLEVVDRGGAVLVTTHDPEVAGCFGRVMRLAGGRLAPEPAPPAPAATTRLSERPPYEP
jgi:putative ABC transport system ATP-binding protein